MKLHYKEIYVLLINCHSFLSGHFTTQQKIKVWNIHYSIFPTAIAICLGYASQFLDERITFIIISLSNC